MCCVCVSRTHTRRIFLLRWRRVVIDVSLDMHSEIWSWGLKKSEKERDIHLYKFKICAGFSLEHYSLATTTSDIYSRERRVQCVPSLSLRASMLLGRLFTLVSVRLHRECVSSPTYRSQLFSSAQGKPRCMCAFLAFESRTHKTLFDYFIHRTLYMLCANVLYVKLFCHNTVYNRSRAIRVYIHVHFQISCQGYLPLLLDQRE